jgi:hypothetical protein
MYKPNWVYLSAFCAVIVFMKLPTRQVLAQGYGQTYSQTQSCTSYWINPATGRQECIGLQTAVTGTNSANRQTTTTYNGSSSSNYIYPITHSGKSRANSARQQTTTTYSSSSSSNYIYPITHSRRSRANSSTSGESSVTYGSSSGNYPVSNSSTTTTITPSTRTSATRYTIKGR